MQIDWIKRNMSYAFWSTVEQIATMAVPRLVLFPLAAYFIGKEQFGIFITALSVTLILGMQPQNGLAMGLLRHFSDYTKEQRSLFCGTSMRMCHWALVVTIFLGLVGITLVGLAGLTPWTLLSCMIPLVISLYPENLFALALTEYRFDRRFSIRAKWFGLRSFSILICGLIGVLVHDATGLAWGYMLGSFFAYFILRIQRRSWYQNPFNRDMATLLRSVWFQMTVAGIIAVSSPYLNRLVLSFFHSYNDVADLVAATSITFIFLTPMACSSGLLLSMIAKYSSIHQFSLRGKLLWLSMLAFGMIALPFFLWAIGPSLMRFMFPTFGEDSLNLLNILIWLVISESLVSLTRPFVIKFSSVRIVPIVNGVSTTMTLIAVFFLVPYYETIGAAWALVIGSLVTGLLWAGMACRLFVTKSQKPAIVT